MTDRFRFHPALRAALATLTLTSAAAAEDPPTDKPEAKPVFELHQWGVWLADPALGDINSREHFTTSLPLSVETTRPRRVKGAQTTAPINVVTFRGQAVPAVEIDLRVQGGALQGSWPAVQSKNNRFRWLDYQLVAAAPDGANWTAAPPEHWFSSARQDAGALVLSKGSRAEKFLTYDFETNFPVPLVARGGAGRLRRSQHGQLSAP